MAILRVLILIASVALIAAQYNRTTCTDGREVIVHLFSWSWSDVAMECERFLGPAGYCGVQISPPNEHAVIMSPHRPWWERYQTVSYLLESRSGTREEFVDMTRRCNRVGVRIYVDAVINHMVGEGLRGTGSGGSGFDARECCVSFPVPYGKVDFNSCGCGDCCSNSCHVNDYNDQHQVRNCRLLSLLDLKLSSDSVRQKIADYFNDVIDIGVAGFRVDACKHMWPVDIAGIYAKIHHLNPEYFPSLTKPFIYNEVIDLGGNSIAADYTHLGMVTEFKYSVNIGRVFRNWDGLTLAYLKSFGDGWGFLPDGDALVFVDNHDNQRGHGADGDSVLSHKEPTLYKRATAFMLAYPYGLTRIMSSYHYQHPDDGPPEGGATINKNGACGGGWVCEHRWRQIKNMVFFRNVVSQQPLANWWDNGKNMIAFSRGNKGFLAINGDDYDMNERLQTGLPGGTYCDVISADIEAVSCTGNTITVDYDGTASIYISNRWQDAMIAIHEMSRVSIPASSGNTAMRAPPPGRSFGSDAPPGDYKRTVIFLRCQSRYGQDVFIRGGRDGRHDCGQCTIPIRHRLFGSSAHYNKHNSWRSRDHVLDWSGPDAGQGRYQGIIAVGTPAVWTSNHRGSPGYQRLNIYGEHYWMVDVGMVCPPDGWFEFKGFVRNGQGWETDLSQASTCTGTAGGAAPYVTNNHLARCGYVNVFSFGENGCEINDF